MSIFAIQEKVGEELDQLENRLRDTAAVQFGPLASVIVDIVASGGKRVRPTLTLLATRFYPCDLDKAISLAAAVETLHTATLVHDDLIDRSPVRRGEPTLYAQWNDAATVLAGDYLFARAANFAAETENVRVMTLFAETLMTICDGEIRQTLRDQEAVPSRDDYYQRIYSKTASLFALSTEAAGELSGAPESEIEALRAYGHNLGMAFQITDDVLDFVGDESRLGKPVGSDLRQGTVTLPIIHYLESHPTEQVLPKVLGDDGQDEAIGEVVSLVRDSAAVDASMEDAREFVAKAQEALGNLPDNQYRQAMIDLTEFVLERRK